MRSISILLLTLSSLLVGCGMTARSSNAGYADIDSLGFRDVDRTMSLSIGPTLLRFAAANIDDDPAARELVTQLDGVRIFTYDVVGDGQRVADRIERMSRKLEAQGWVPVIQVRERDQRTVMLMKVRREHIAGLTLLTTDSEEAVIVNVMGELRPTQFSGTMAALDVDVPGVHLGQREL